MSHKRAISRRLLLAESRNVRTVRGSSETNSIPRSSVDGPSRLPQPSPCPAHFDVFSAEFRCVERAHARRMRRLVESRSEIRESAVPRTTGCFSFIYQKFACVRRRRKPRRLPLLGPRGS